MRRYSQRQSLSTLSEINVRNDTIRFNDQAMDLETLTTQLMQLKETNPGVAIVIRPDRDLPVQKLIGVMDALRRAGITKVGIATKAEPN